MSKAAAIRAVLGTRTLRIIGVACAALCGLSLCVLTLLYFEWWMGLWLVALAIITHASPGWGLGLLFLSVSLDPARPVLGQIFISYSKMQIAVFLSSWFGGGLWRERKLIHDWRLVSWSAPFLFIVLLSGLLSSSVPRAVGNSMRVAEMFVLAFAVVNLLRDSAGPRFRVFLFVAALFYSLLGIFQFPFVEWGRIYSTFTNPNQFAGYLNLVLPFAVVLFLSSRGWERTRWGYLSAVVLVAGAATLARAGFLAGLLGVLTVLLLYLYYRPRPELRRLFSTLTSNSRSLLLHALVAIILVVALLLIPPTQQTLHNSFRNIAGRSSGGFVSSFRQVRQPYFAVGWAIWKENLWLGVGPGNYTRALQQKRDLVSSYRGNPVSYRIFVRSIGSHVHNLYLQTGVNFGILGLAAFLYFFLRVLLALPRDAKGSPAAIAGVGLLAAFLLHNLLDVTFPSLGIEMGILLGLAFNTKRL